ANDDDEQLKENLEGLDAGRIAFGRQVQGELFLLTSPFIERSIAFLIDRGLLLSQSNKSQRSGKR
ncbi:MAG: hypothetical protein ACRD1O_02000, partial [Terriglobia bacterium]